MDITPDENLLYRFTGVSRPQKTKDDENDRSENGKYS